MRGLGVIRASVANIDTLFQHVFDKDGSGFVDREELARGMRRLLKQSISSGGGLPSPGSADSPGMSSPAMSRASLASSPASSPKRKSKATSAKGAIVEARRAAAAAIEAAASTPARSAGWTFTSASSRGT